jgi:hypothetical protein
MQSNYTGQGRVFRIAWAARNLDRTLALDYRINSAGQLVSATAMQACIHDLTTAPVDWCDRRLDHTSLNLSNGYLNM